jgi:pimeloyl-ACP methyl ester carboxylesterase
MEAALRVKNLRRLVLYEPAFPVGNEPLYQPEIPAKLHSLLATGDREQLLLAFFGEVVGATDTEIARLQADPSWTNRIAAAHTAVRELADGDYEFDSRRFQALEVPTLLLYGERSPQRFKEPAKQLSAVLPASRIVALEGQGHVAMTTNPDLFLSEVMKFLAGA